jgi:hypothetical protein
MKQALSALAVALLLAVVVTPASGSRPLSAATIAFWTRVAQCETGATWSGLGSTYQGGLGFYRTTWDAWAREMGVYDRYPDAGMAPRLTQIAVADYGYRVHGGYWGCLN